MSMANEKQRDPTPAEIPGPDDRHPAPGGVGNGLSGGVTDIDRRDGEADDSNSGYSDEDLMRTGGGGLGERATGDDVPPRD